MTKQELRDRVSVSSCGCGQYKVQITYRGKEYKCHSTNSTAYDCLPTGGNFDGYEEYPDAQMTGKQALQSFYDECKRANNLGEYSY